MLTNLLSKPTELWAGQVWTTNKKKNPFNKDEGFWTVAIDEVKDGFILFTRDCVKYSVLQSRQDSLSEKDFRKVYCVLKRETDNPFRYCAEEMANISKTNI